MGGRAIFTGTAWLLAATAPAVLAAPCAAQAMPEPELRIVELRLRDRIMLAENLIAWQSGEDLFLPAQDAFVLAGFPIEVDAAGVAEGWFLRENQRFTLDPQTGQVEVAGRSFTLEPADYRVIEGVPHVSLSALNRWFSMGAGFLAARQVVVLAPPYLLPDEETARRAFGRQTGPGRGEGIDTTGFVPVAADYRLIGWPHITANLALSYDGAARNQWGGSAQVLAVGDLLFATGRLAASYDSRGQSSARLTLGRADAQAQLLGPLGASYFDFGDIASDSLPLISRAGSGLGLRVGREPLTRADRFDSTNIIGDATPGWQAELYRDGELLSFQEIGSDGRYLFPDVPLRFGSNRFRVQLYGPAGERETVDRVFDIADTLIEPGALRYSLAVYDAGSSLLGAHDLLENGVDGFGTRLNDGLFAEASAGFGLSKQVSVSGFAAYSDPRTGASSAWLGASGALRLQPMLLSATLAVQDNGAAAWQAGLVTGLGPVSVTLDHSQFARGFDSEENRFGSASGIASRSEAALDLRLPRIGIALALTQTRQFDGTRDRSAEVRLSGTVLGISATHRLGWRLLDQPGQAQLERFDGALTLSGNLGALRLRGGLDYDITPSARIRRARAEASYRLENWYLLAGFEREFVEDSGQWRIGANRDWNGVRLGLEGRYDDRRKDARVLATLSFAFDRGNGGGLRFGRAARSDRGRLQPRGFHDMDNNGHRDAGEPDIALRFVTDPRGRQESDAGLIEDLPVDRVIAVVPDLTSNPDPFLVPRDAGYALTARPGAVARIDVPLVDSADAEIILLEADGTPAAGTLAVLTPCGGGPAAATRAAHDGLAYFRQLLPGCYVLSRPAGFAGQIELEPKDVLRRTITLAAPGTAPGGGS